jgi:tetratricopeptide (TPR) repeat protein
MSKFSSEGFDLDALAGSSCGDADGVASGDATADVVYEIGGGATSIPKLDATTPNEGSTGSPQLSSCPPGAAPSTPLDTAEEWKQKGNDEFRRGNYLEAYDLYTEAIEACPCPVKAGDVLRQRDEFNEAEREKARQRMDEETAGRRSLGRNRNSARGEAEGEGKEANSKDANSSSEQTGARDRAPSVFELPPQENGDKLAIFYCNRAATLIHLNRYEESIQDCDVAVLLHPKYTKAYVRRSAAFEKTERTEEALKDMKQALELEPSNASVRASVARLQKIENERLEKLKVGLAMM